MNNLWRDVILSQEKMSLLDRCNISKLPVSVSMYHVCMILQSEIKEEESVLLLWLPVCADVLLYEQLSFVPFIVWTDKPQWSTSSVRVIPDWLFCFFPLPLWSHLLIEFPFYSFIYLFFQTLILCRWRRLSGPRRKLLFHLLFPQNPSSSRLEIKVVLCKDKPAKLADTWFSDIIDNEHIYHSIIKWKTKAKRTDSESQMEGAEYYSHWHTINLAVFLAPRSCIY